MHKLITILNPETLLRDERFVLIPRREYEVLTREHTHTFPEVKLTAAQKKDMAKNRAQIRKGEYLTLAQVW